ncbi:hypothetical protein HYT25_01240, partial [Candidatus Pacearchaeota archaeon]|nr:hypothetical protein [Candidatus Pacearchaeota archaeon]
MGSGGTYFNITNITWSEGLHNVTVYVNDSAGNLNYTSISFTVDTIQPDINITYPFNNTVVSDTGADVNYTRSDLVGLFNCWYSNDTYLVNTTLASCENITTITWSSGIHNVTIWVNDSAGNYNRSTINFSISANNPPEIRNVYNDTSPSLRNAGTGLSAGPANTSIIINFSVFDAEGVANMNNATATINFSRNGEALRQNSSCNQYEVATNVANYTCNITMMWFDGAGT